MAKSIGKRFLSIMLVIVMILTLLPVIEMPASAANVNTGVTGLTADSSGNATWNYSSGTINGSVKASSSSGCSGTTYTAQTGTLTFTNSSGAVALLSFDYSLTLSGGSATIDGADVTASGAFSKKLEAGETVAVSLTSNAADSNATSISFSNLKLTEEKDVEITFKAPANGSYTVDGQAITAQTVKTVKTTDSVALAATPASGYKFFGWYSEPTGVYFSTAASLTTSFTEAQTVEPKFVSSSAPVFQVGSNLYTDLNLAANDSSSNKIVLVSNGTLPAGDYTIPSGKTLLIPFDEAQTVYTTTPAMTVGSDGKPAAHVNPSAFRTLTMASGAKITVASGGAVCVPSMLSAVGTNTTSWNATPTGKHGRITMNSGSSIDVQSGGKLYAWGYISGSGNVYARSGSEIWECFQIRCWRGGTATSGMAGNSQKVFPLNQYYVQNIEAPLTYYPGATEKVFAAVNMSNQQFGASATFVGSGGMFQLSSGSMTKRFTGATDRLELAVDGDFTVSPMSLTITGLPLVGTLDLNTADYVLPIQSNITLNINSGTTTLKQDVAFLPGSEMTIASGASVTVANGHKAYVYDQDQWGAYAAGGAQLVVVGYSTVNGTNAKRTAASLVDAKIDVNGTLTAAGQIYTTQTGAAIISSQGTGKYVLQNAPGTATSTYMATQSGSDITYVSIPITAAKLQHADGSYYETSGKKAGTEVPYANGRWGAEMHTITWVDEDGTVLATDQVEEGEMPVYKGETPTKTGDAQFSYTFEGWTPEVAAVTGDATYTATYGQSVNTYTVKWLDEDGNILKTDENVPYGTTPSYDGTEPTKEPTAAQTFTFSGWDPEIAAVTADVSYTAQFTASTRQYTVTWNNYDGTELKSEFVDYGETPVYTGETPIKPGDVAHSYAFSGWSPEVGAVTGDVTYTAQFAETTNTYTVVWKNYDGEILETDENVPYGTTPSFDGDVPTKEGDAQFTYTFSGWSPEVSAVEGDATYTAQFTETVNTYTVVWKNYDGTVLETDSEVPYGDMPEYNGNTPEKAADAQYTYYFDGWAPAVETVKGNAEYTATFSTSVNEYTVKFLNWDGAELQVSCVAYGETPAYDDIPTRAPDAQYTYTFSGWDPQITAVTGEATYTAQFDTTVNKYTITWKNEDGTVIQTDADQEYGTNLFSIKPADPAKPNPDILKDYVFNGWVPETGSSEVVGENDIVTGDAIFVATFAESDRIFTYNWYGANGELLYTTTDIPNQSPEYKGETPTKASTAQYNYTFANDWQRADDLENGVVTFTARFNEELRQYVITFVGADGTALQTDPFDYGATPAYYGETPTKEGDAQYSYTFAGWSPEITAVTGEATYTAQFSATVNKYTITWKNFDGNVLETDENVPYGDTPEFNSTTPVKPADDANTYVFSGWSPEVSAVTGDVEYTAQFTAAPRSYTVRFLNWNGEELQSGDVPYGTTPAYTGVTPTKPGDMQFTYTFSGWDPEIAPVSGEATYTAQFDETVNKYLVKFVDEDGTELQSGEVAYGEMPTFTGETPTKAETARYTYEFSGWTPAIVEVTGEATYTATFTETGKNGLCVEGEDTYWIENGENVPFPGLVRIVLDDGTINYYYFGEDGKAVKGVGDDVHFKVEKNNGLPLPCLNYTFGPDGVIVHDPDTSKNGVCEGDGSVFYYIDGVKVGMGLVKIDGSYYYARTSTGEIVRGRTYWVSQTNGYPIEKAMYTFDENGILQLNGFITAGSYTYYYTDGVPAKGFTKIGDDYYFFNAGNGRMYTSKTLWVGANDYGFVPAYYDFGADGKMVKTGFVTGGDGYTYYYEDGVRVNGFTEIDGDYYFFNAGNGKLYKDIDLWVGDNAYGFSHGMYHFGADGKMVVPTTEIKNGFIEENGYTYYYVDDVCAKGFTEIDGDYYFFNAGNGRMYKDARLWIGANDYGVTPGYYNFGADGKMVQS